MAMNSSGPISLGGATAGQSINLENGNSATAQVSLNDTAVRNLAGVPSGAITMPTNFYGKSNIVNISYTFSTNTANAALNLSTISGYSAGKSNITVTVNSGVYLYATSTGSYGLNLSGGTTGDTLVLVNNGYIIGQGGSGNVPLPAQPGGPALNLGFGMSSCTINNTNASAYIAGGGGGGRAGGGGAGGGAGYDNGYGGGSGGGVGASGTPGGSSGGGYGNTSGSGGGGRILPGSGGAGGSSGNGGAGQGGGAGGGSGAFISLKGSYTDGGPGGGGTSSGGSGGGNNGGGGGWGANGGGVNNFGSGGKAVNLNGKSVTWTSGNTTRVYGAVS